MLDSNLIPLNKQTLLSNIAALSASMNMPCYLVGGFVRDLLLQKPVRDLDVIVEGNAIQLGEALVKQYGGKLTAHHKFNTAVWEISEILDLITARSEIYQHAGALPTVKPATIEDDIRRRDFTINAMAVRMDGGHFGELLDPLNGQSDLSQGVIRALNPRSFIDDPTRIFRAVRYEQRYGFSIAPETLTLINDESFKILSKLSGERIRHEFDLIFEEEKFALMLFRLKELRLLEALNLPEFNKDYAGFDFMPDSEFNVYASRILFGYLFWLMDSPIELVKSISKRLDFNFELSSAALAVIQLKNDLSLLKDSKPSVWTFHLEKFPAVSIYALWLTTKEFAFKEFLVKWKFVKSITTGENLKARGIPPGPRYKEILSQLRSAWLDGDVSSMDQEVRLLEKIIK